MLDTLKVKTIREKLGLTLDEAAKRAGQKSRQAWWNIENDAEGRITLSTLDKVAAALGVKAKDLLK